MVPIPARRDSSADITDKGSVRRLTAISSESRLNEVEVTWTGNILNGCT